ncbi:hypothetical protein NGM37_30960, partial [Streptomyces sp. TRM76130]|nr:hypothetical protein [Streptomyces sp. TRM76130]
STTADLDIGPTGKTMHWITTDKVPHDDMLTLIKASEPIMMTTGNQSTSEALSAGKTMLYESIGKDQSKAFRHALYSGAKLKAQEIGHLAAISRDYDRQGPPPGRPEYQAAAATLQKMQQENTMGAYSDRAWATKDLGRWIGGRHLRDYLMSTELAGGLRSEEAKLRQAPREASAYKDFVQHLLGLPEGGK